MRNAGDIAQGVLLKVSAKKDEPGEMPEEPKVDTPFEAKPGKAMWSKDQRKAMSDASKLQKLQRFGENVANDKPIAKWAGIARRVLEKNGYNLKQISNTGEASTMNDRLNSISNPRTFGGNSVTRAATKKPKASNVHVTQLG